MNYQCEEAKLSAKEVAEIYRNMEAKGLNRIFWKACSEEIKPEQARKSSTGLNITQISQKVSDLARGVYS